MLEIKHDINTIFVMLGQQCNLNCKYCMQHDLIIDVLPKRFIHHDVINFIKYHANKQERPIDIRFYGGEPLIYFNDIKQIVNLLKKDNVSFSIISNGKLINENIVKFFNDNNFSSVAISWDGIDSIKTRLYDVFKEKQNLLLNINNLCISGVISSFNYPNSFINSIKPFIEEYYRIHNYMINFSKDEIMDMNAYHSDLRTFDYNEINKQMNILVNNIKKSFVNMETSNISLNDYLYISLFTMYCNSIQSGLNSYTRSFCGNGINVINLDLEGNLYQCHNNWIKIGDINSDYNTYILKAKELDTITLNNFNSTCKNCSILSLCKCGCPLIKQDIREKTDFCKLRKAIYEPIINLVNEAIANNGSFY